MRKGEPDGILPPYYPTTYQERALRKGEPDGTGVKPGYCDSRYYRILAGGPNHNPHVNPTPTPTPNPNPRSMDR